MEISTEQTFILNESLERSASPRLTRGEVIATVTTGIAFFMIVLDTSIVNLALPSIKDAFQADLSTLQWLVDGYALVFASLLLSAGALGDRFDAKRICPPAEADLVGISYKLNTTLFPVGNLTIAQ